MIISIFPSLAIAESKCYEFPRWVQLPKALKDYSPESFSPESNQVILSHAGNQILFGLNDFKIENLGKITDPTFSSNGTVLSYEIQGEKPEIQIRDLKNHSIKKISVGPTCGHQVSDQSELLNVFTCRGEFKTYDLKSNPPSLIRSKKLTQTFHPESIHFHLDTRAHLIFTPNDIKKGTPSLLHLIDFKQGKTYSAPMTAPRLMSVQSYLESLNAPMTSSETQNELARTYPQGGARFSSDGRKVLIWNSDSSAIHFDLDQNQVTPLSKGQDRSLSFALSPKGTYLFSRKEGTSTLEHEGWIHPKKRFRFYSFTLSNDDSKIAYIPPDRQEIRITDPFQKKEIKIKPSPESGIDLSKVEPENIFFNPDSTQLLVLQNHYETPQIHFFDATDGQLEKTTTLNKPINYIPNHVFLDQGKSLVIGNSPHHNQNGFNFIVHLDTGKVEEFGRSDLHLSPGSDPKMIVWPYLGFKDTFFHISKICPSSLKTAPPLLQPCAQALQPSDILEQALKLEQDLFENQIDSKTIQKQCENYRKTGNMNEVTVHSLEKLFLKEPSNSKDQIRAQLLALQNDSISFDPQRTLTLIEVGMSNSLFQSDSSLFQNVLLRIFHENKALYYKIVEKYPQKKRFIHSLETSCFSPALIDLMKKELKSYLVNSSKQAIPLSEIERLYPLSPLFNQLNTKELNEVLENLGLAAARAAQNDFPGVMTSTLYYFISPRIRANILDVPVPAYTELSMMKNKNTLIPVILSTREINSEPQTFNRHGFYSQTLQKPKLPDPQHKETLNSYSWQIEDVPYHADVNLKHVSATELFPNRISPNYDELWKDQSLTGLILLSSNLGKDAKSIGDEYVRYFKEKGFTFDWRVKELSDPQNLIQEKIQSGEIDYLLKDAHSGGVLQDLVTLLSQARLLTGSRLRPDGKKERVYILIPSDGGSTRTISTADFGSWVRDRQKNGLSELVYFNTSCFGGDRAATDVSEAGTPHLLVIPVDPIQTTNYFLNKKDDAIYQLLESIRDNKSFSGFRENLNHVVDYRERNRNVYLLPDEPEYQEKIVNRLKEFPISARIMIYDQKNREVHFDPLRSSTPKEAEKQ